MRKVINDNVLGKIRKSKLCKAKLQIALDKSAVTIQRYLDTNDIMLTTTSALEVIKNEFNLIEEEIITAEIN